MADQGREALELMMGAMMAQAAVLEFMVKQGLIERDLLLVHLASRRISWETTAPPTALFPLDLLASLLAGRPPPAPPSALH